MYPANPVSSVAPLFLRLKVAFCHVTTIPKPEIRGQETLVLPPQRSPKLGRTMTASLGRKTGGWRVFVASNRGWRRSRGKR